MVRSVLLIIGAGIAASGIVSVFSLVVPRNSPLGLFSNLSALALGAGAETYAVGYVMNKHFESGGTLESFDLKKSRQHLSDLYAEGKNHTKTMLDKKMKRTKTQDDENKT